MSLNAVEADFKKKIEAQFPGRTVIPPRVANLTEVREHQAELGRGPRQFRSQCHNGCSYGAYFSSLSATLPAAVSHWQPDRDHRCHRPQRDPRSENQPGHWRARDRCPHQKSQDLQFEGGVPQRLTIPTAQILLASTSAAFPNGLANSSDMVGRNLMDHVGGAFAVGMYPGFDDRYYRGRRPQATIIPRYRNVDTQEDYLRGFGLVALAFRSGWGMTAMSPIGVGASAKALMRKPGPWMLFVGGGGEMLPNRENRITLHPSRNDQWGMPIPHIACEHGENDRKLVAAAQADAEAMLNAAGAKIVARAKVRVRRGRPSTRWEPHTWAPIPELRC